MADLPEGTVTFLFSDIEGSTRLLERLGSAYGELLETHHRLLREVFEANGGVEVDTQGDAFFVSFSKASQALAAALAAQVALGAHPWPGGEVVRVRMGLHSCEASVGPTGYVGVGVHRGARTCSAAHGGQVLVSESTRALVASQLPPGVALVDLGTHRLKDLAEPEHLFQLAHPELPAEFPPVRSLEAHPHNLPVQLSPFVGRTEELHDLEALVDESRLVTLTSMGGGGKTRLALQLAAGVLGRFPEGVFFVDLAPLRDPGLVPFAAASALGVLSSEVAVAPGAVADRLCGHLEPRRALLVFDNCEHVIDAVASLVEEILRRCPAVVVVATSRELLGLAGEVAWRVPSLSLPPAGATRPEDLAGSDAVALFCARASAAQPHFALNPATAPAVAEICRRLDGIPLALELAAVRLRVLSAEQVARRLDDRFALLTGGTRGAIARHQTLRISIDWSYELLDPSEQAALRRLAVFPATFDYEAAEAVIAGAEGGDDPPGAGPDVLDLLAHLVDKSLVTVDSSGAEARYRLLETVRQYGCEKLEGAAEAEATRRRHRDFYLALVRDGSPSTWLSGPRWAELERRIGVDDANFRAALEWSLAGADADASLGFTAGLWVYWRHGGHLLESLGWLERALALAPRPRHPARVESLVGSAWLSWNCGRSDADHARQTGEEALRLALELGDRPGEARARFFLAELALAEGDPGRAQRLGEEALAVAQASDLDLGTGWCHYTLGNVALARGDVPEARAHYERTVEVVARVEQSDRASFLAAHALAALAPLVAADGDPERAQSLADEAVDTARGLPLPQVLVMALVRGSETAVLTGRSGKAAAALREALRLLANLGARRWVADALESVALVRESQGDPDSAARLLGACDALRQALGESRGGRCIAAEIETCRRRTAAALGADAYGVQSSRGQGLPVAEAISSALGELDKAGGVALVASSASSHEVTS